MATSVFVTGASGYIGLAVATALRNSGFKVYGLVRTEEKAALLRKNEIIPVLGDIQKPETYEKIVEKSAIIVDNVMDHHAADALSGNKKLLELANKTTHPLRKKRFIYTSGVLVHGDSKEVADDDTFNGGAFPMVKARLAFEDHLLSQDNLDTVVVRPCFVYGGVWTVDFFAPKEKVVIRGNKDRKFSWVHVQDLADAYVRVAQAPASVVNKQAFDIASSHAPTFEEVIIGCARVAGYKGEFEYGDPDPSDFISVLANTNTVVSSKKATDLLGWHARHLGLLDELEIYYETWKAAKGK